MLRGSLAVFLVLLAPELRAQEPPVPDPRLLARAERILEQSPIIDGHNDLPSEILDRFAELKLEADPQRLEQEMVLLAQKSDVAEELDRLSTHVAEVRRVLKAGGAAGRRLDFLMQELNREANTLGSKAFDPRSTQAAVNLKVLIEQMREQVQNIE